MPKRFCKHINTLTARLAGWRMRTIPDGAFIFIVASVIGALAGLTAHIMKWLIGIISAFAIGNAQPDVMNYRLLIFPCIGLVLTSLYSRYIARADMAHGTSKLIRDVRSGHFNLPSRFIYSPVVGCSLTMGLGGSAGAEGPIAYSGAAIGSSLGRLFKVSPRFMMILFGCGAAAAIAGIYKAPIGGALYTLEVLKLELSTLSVIALLTTCLIASMVSFSMSAYSPDVSFVQHTMFDPSILPAVVVLGIFLGLYSLIYFKTMRGVGGLLVKVKNTLAKNIIAGLILAALVFLFPSFFGEGLGSMERVLDGDFRHVVDSGALYSLADSGFAVIMIFGFSLLAKAVAVGTTNYGGGVSGNFTPTLFAGCMAGLFFAMASNALFGTTFDTANFALMGMAGVMAGVIRAPLMAIFLTTEITQNLNLLLPITLSAAISFCIVKIFSKRPFFQSVYIIEDLKEPSDKE